MTLSFPPGSLEEVLGEYLQRLDGGEAVDREQLLARHPDLADELRSYFAGADEVERLTRPSGGGPPPAAGGSDPPPTVRRPALAAPPPTRGLPEPDPLDALPWPRDRPPRVGDY